MRSLIPLSLILTLFGSCSVQGLKLPFHVQTGNPPSPNNRLGRRANTTIPVTNTQNAQYISNITLGGVQVAVLLDTGSSDLWVNFPGTAPSTTDMGKSVTLAYAVGKAAGNIHSTTLQFDNYTVNDQAFLLVTDTSTFSGDIHSQGYDGLVGLGPNDGSLIRQKINSAAGDTMLSRIFEQNKTTQNYISFLLDRKGDPKDPFTGQLTISELVPGFENITSMPKLDVETVHKLLESDQHWQALTDKDSGIIGPDGQIIKIDSIVPKAPSGQLVAVIDSGFTFSQVPREVSDAIYGRVHGALYDTKHEYWTVPCGQLLNLTFKFGGNSYPVHPLDVVNDDFGITDGNGNKVCIGTFQPITSAFSLLGNYDMILGMSFLRNSYTLLDFGNWINTASNDRGNPYIQLLSVTNPNDAYNDFVQVRLGGKDTTNDPQWALLPTSQMQHSPVSAEEKKMKYQEKILSRWPYFLAGGLVFVLLLVGLCVWRCCCRRGAKKTKGPRASNGFFSKKAASTAYLPLQVNQGHSGGHGDYGAGGQGYNGHH